MVIDGMLEFKAINVNLVSTLTQGATPNFLRNRIVNIRRGRWNMFNLFLIPFCFVSATSNVSQNISLLIQLSRYRTACTILPL